MQIHEFDIVVVGGGPSGAAAAIGLQRLGYRVGLVAEPRPFAALEGISARVIDGLRGAGLCSPLAQLPPASPRRVRWNGLTSAANQETLVERRSFDRALVTDLRNAGVQVFETRAAEVAVTAGGCTAELGGELRGQQLRGAFLVEARGRSAPAAGIERFRGPDTLSLLHYWQGQEAEAQPFSAVESFQDGWAWMAVGGNGLRYLQLTLDAASTRLPGKSGLPAFCEARLRPLSQSQPFIDGASPTDRVHARTSASVLHRQVVGDRWIRVGDAAMAVDPLSGNGIFQALSSALIAPAVISTLLKYPQDAGQAKDFYQRRISELFYRFSRIGRDFYRMESQWPQRPFWRDRSDWPDAQPVHPAAEPGSWRIERLPVVDGERIRAAEVLVTTEQPLGIWHLQGMALAPLVKLLQRHRDASLVAQCRILQSDAGLSQAQSRMICGWVASQQLF